MKWYVTSWIKIWPRYVEIINEGVHISFNQLRWKSERRDVLFTVSKALEKSTAIATVCGCGAVLVEP